MKHPPTITAASLADGIGRALLSLISSHTPAGGWLAFPLRVDADEMRPAQCTDAGLIITRETVDQCARAQGVRLASRDVDAALALVGLAVNSAATQTLTRVVAQLADPARDDGAARAVADAIGELAEGWTRDSAPFRATAAIELREADAVEQADARAAWTSTHSGGSLAAALVRHDAARAALAAAQCETEEDAREVARVLARWATIAREDEARADAAGEEGGANVDQ